MNWRRRDEINREIEDLLLTSNVQVLNEIALYVARSVARYIDDSRVDAAIKAKALWMRGDLPCCYLMEARHEANTAGRELHNLTWEPYHSAASSAFWASMDNMDSEKAWRAIRYAVQACGLHASSCAEYDNFEAKGDAEVAALEEYLEKFHEIIEDVKTWHATV